MIEVLGVMKQATQIGCREQVDVVEGLIDSVSDTEDLLYRVREIVSCATLSPLLTKFLSSVFCSDILNALVSLWVGALLSGFFLFFSMLYFNKATSVEADEDRRGIELDNRK